MATNPVRIVKNGVVVELPPGFRFHPTDEELVVQYLARMIFDMPLPANIIPRVEVCKSDPWDLPGEKNEERYFFSTREAKYPNGHRSNRATGAGYWKATGVDRKVLAVGRNNQVVGYKKTLVFYHGKPAKGTRTDWIMHEYRMDSTFGDRIVKRCAPAMMQEALAAKIEQWVLCRVFLKKRGGRSESVAPANAGTGVSSCGRDRPILVDLNEAPASSSCGSSGMTDDEVEVDSN